MNFCITKYVDLVSTLLYWFLFLFIIIIIIVCFLQKICKTVFSLICRKKKECDRIAQVFTRLFLQLRAGFRYGSILINYLNLSLEFLPPGSVCPILPGLASMRHKDSFFLFFFETRYCCVTLLTNGQFSVLLIWPRQYYLEKVLLAYVMPRLDILSEDPRNDRRSVSFVRSYLCTNILISGREIALCLKI